MDSIPLKNILDGSRAWGLWASLFRHSVFRTVLAGCRQRAFSVLGGSHTLSFVRTRIWPLLLVGDYLDRPLRLNSTTLEDSVFWTRLSAALARTGSWFGSLRESCALAESRLLKKLRATGLPDAPRRTTAIAVLFCAVYYLFRILLQLWLPTAQYRAGWASGLALALLLAASLKLISRR